MRVLLAGASGYIGEAVAATLIADGHQVLALHRSDGTTSANGGHSDKSKNGAYERCVASVTDRSALARALAEEDVASRPIDAVISCIASRTGVADDAWAVDYQANRHLLELATERGAIPFVLLSAICVQRPRLAFQHAKLAFERELTDSACPHSIVRPTAFFKSLSGQIERVRRGEPFLVFGNGELTACKPISAADLARFIVQCLDDPKKRNGIFPIGGPGAALTPRMQGELLFELTQRPVQFRRVPPALLSASAAAMGLFSWCSRAAREKSELARIGHYYATESMLVWDAERGCYDEQATPSFGTETLRDYYEGMLRAPTAVDELGNQRLFS